MHPIVSTQSFVKSSLESIANHLTEDADEVRSAVSAAIQTDHPETVERERANLAAQFTAIRDSAGGEPSHGDVDYVSRIHLVGLYQSVLAKVFSRIPGLQGYGNRNPVWAASLIEQGWHRLGDFFKNVHEDVDGKKEPLIQSILKEWKTLSFDRAPYPPGTPKVVQLPDNAKIALLADWGGDNPAARHIAAVVSRQRPTIAIHLGDIYYGGIKSECETFLRLWPLQTNSKQPEIGVPPGSSLALNGNHEMYSGGESYFSVVLKAFGQPQPFFCLENKHWRIIGLDTAYAGGRLNPSDPDDPIKTQWKWLIETLRNSGSKKNILLTHHQPVSAHSAEFHDSEGLRKDVEDLLAIDGVGKDAIFGWFFGHEHRCALYRDTETAFNARLIGNGCIPHEVQAEREADAGCTPVDFFNKRQDECNSGAAVSMCAVLTFMDQFSELLIEYVDEDFESWGTEVWSAEKGRFGGGKFQEQDFDDKLARRD